MKEVRNVDPEGKPPFVTSLEQITIDILDDILEIVTRAAKIHIQRRKKNPMALLNQSM